MKPLLFNASDILNAPQTHIVRIKGEAIVARLCDTDPPGAAGVLAGGGLLFGPPFLPLFIGAALIYVAITSP